MSRATAEGPRWGETTGVDRRDVRVGALRHELLLRGSHDAVVGADQRPTAMDAIGFLCTVRTHAREPDPTVRVRHARPARSDRGLSLYALRGERAKAEHEYDTVQLIGTLAKINRKAYNRLVAVFDADHDRKQADAVANPKLLYHAGMIAKAEGERARARDLLRRAHSISPKFDPYQAPIAQRALRAVE